MNYRIEDRTIYVDVKTYQAIAILILSGMPSDTPMDQVPYLVLSAIGIPWQDIDSLMLDSKNIRVELDMEHSGEAATQTETLLLELLEAQKLRDMSETAPTS